MLIRKYVRISSQPLKSFSIKGFYFGIGGIGGTPGAGFSPNEGFILVLVVLVVPRGYTGGIQGPPPQQKK